MKIRIYQELAENVFNAGATATIDGRRPGTPSATRSSMMSASDSGNLMRLAGGFYIYNLSTSTWSSASGARFKVVVRIAKPGHVDTLCEVIPQNR